MAPLEGRVGMSPPDPQTRRTPNGGGRRGFAESSATREAQHRQSSPLLEYLAGRARELTDAELDQIRARLLARAVAGAR